MTDTWEGHLQPLTDPSSLTINQFVMVLLIALIEQMNNVCDVIKDCSYLHCYQKVRPGMADVIGWRQGPHWLETRSTLVHIATSRSPTEPTSQLWEGDPCVDESPIQNRTDWLKTRSTLAGDKVHKVMTFDLCHDL